MFLSARSPKATSAAGSPTAANSPTASESGDQARVWVRSSAIPVPPPLSSKFWNGNSTTTNESNHNNAASHHNNRNGSNNNRRLTIATSSPATEMVSQRALTTKSSTLSILPPARSSSSIKPVISSQQQQQLSHSFSSTQNTADLTDSSCDASCNSGGVTTGRVMQWGWKEGVLHEQRADKLVIHLADTAQVLHLPVTTLEEGSVVLANDVDPVTGLPAAPHDLIGLTHLHEPSVCLALQQRYAQDIIYTNTGPVLLALNPFGSIAGLYGDAVQRKYVEAAEKLLLGNLPPHVYAIADNAFRSMMRALEDRTVTVTPPPTTTTAATNVPSSDSHSIATLTTIKNSSARHSINQSILVSGESGSGKTVTTKFVMKYLAALSQRSVQLQETQRAHIKAAASTKRHEDHPPSQWNAAHWRNSNHNNKSQPNSTETNNTLTVAGNSIEAQVLQSNPILESFGNARTVRNDNSSRFGKFIEIQFTAQGKLVGAVMHTYLLEKVRLNRQCFGERNYHIFYELLSGGINQRDLSHFFLAPTAGPEDFKLTNGSGTVHRRDGVSDRETFAGLLVALQTMKFTKTDIQDVLSVTAAILHASNLTFVDLDNDTCCLDEQNVHVRPVCTLLGLTMSDLNQALCHCTLTAGDSVVKRSLSSAQAATGLESLSKETYGALFQYLVQRINGQIADAATTQGAAATIGVLDIFGFESFTVNSFEQLCINYCNEALQQQFNAFVLENEQAEYEREGIQWSFIEFPENQDVLDLMEKRGSSILSILDDQCRAPGPSDKGFCLAVYSQCGNLPRFGATRKQQAMLQFSVHHYAGPVEYTVAGFTAKNKDELPKETVVLLGSSEMPLVKELAAFMEASHEAIGGGGTSSSEQPTPRKQLYRADSSVGRPTVGGQFRLQLRTLRQKIDRTAPHYIRCLKPNDLLVPDHFDTAIVAEQLKCGGILEAVRVARAGFTQHYTHADFCRRYRALAWKELSGTGHVAPTASPLSVNTKWSQPLRKTTNAATNSTSFRHSYPLLPSYVPKSNSSASPKITIELSPAEAKSLCKELIKVLYRKMQQLGVSVATDSNASSSGSVAVAADSGGQRTLEPPAHSKTYSYNTPSKFPPSWSKGTAVTPPASFLPPSGGSGSVRPKFHSGGRNKVENKSTLSATPTSPQKSWKRGTALTGADFAKVGIQMGKNKVFLRHKAFEALERIRCLEQTKAATTLNSIFRTYLARSAYIPYRNAFRQAQERRKLLGGGSGGGMDEFKETKESDDYTIDVIFGDGANKSFQSARSMHSGGGNSLAHGESFVEKWTELQIREAIHNPVPRHEWGKQVPDAAKFRWVIRDGLWVKNYDF